MYYLIGFVIGSSITLGGLFIYDWWKYGRRT